MGAGPKINHTTVKGIATNLNKFSFKLILNFCAEKPNHNLMYRVGPDFCIEDPTNTPFQVLITCPLANKPQPPPEFQWTILYNDSELDLNDLPSLQVFTESDMLNLSGVVELGENVMLTIACTVENEYGSDEEITLISLCGEKKGRKCVVVHVY